MSDIILTTFDWVPELPRGNVRDLRVRWALEEAGLVRMSRETAIDCAFKYATKPRPISRAASSLTSCGYSPRTSYALKTAGLMDVFSMAQMRL